MIDFIICPNGSVWTFEPATEAAKEFAATALDIESWQWLGPAFAVDHRVAGDLAAALGGEGFILAE